MSPEFSFVEAYTWANYKVLQHCPQVWILSIIVVYRCIMMITFSRITSVQLNVKCYSWTLSSCCWAFFFHLFNFNIVDLLIVKCPKYYFTINSFPVEIMATNTFWIIAMYNFKHNALKIYFKSFEDILSFIQYTLGKWV